MQHVSKTATAMPITELNPTPVAAMSTWAGTLPGLMAGKRPPQGSPRLDIVREEESWEMTVGARYTVATGS